MRTKPNGQIITNRTIVIIPGKFNQMFINHNNNQEATEQEANDYIKAQGLKLSQFKVINHRSDLTHIIKVK